MNSLRWWFIFCASLVGLGTAAGLGLVTRLWIIDQTKISFGILGLYFVVSVWIGVLTWRCDASRCKQVDRKTTVTNLGALEEASDLCMRLAIIGTTLGFAIMVAGTFGAGTLITPGAIVKLAGGLSLIYLVTAVGVLCSSLLNLQIVNLRELVEE